MENNVDCFHWLDKNILIILLLYYFKATKTTSVA